MASEISKGLKWTFFIHFLVTLFFGFIFTTLVHPISDHYLGIIDWPYFDPITTQLFGFTFYAFALSSFIAWKETKWEKVKTIVIMEIAWFMGGIYVMFWSLFLGITSPFFPELPFMGWVYLIIFCAFLIAFIIFYIQHEKERKKSN